MEKGLTSQQAAEKLKAFGKNEIITTSSFSALSLFLSQLPTVINGILALAAIFSFAIKNLIDGFFILAILFLNAVFGFIQEYRAEKSLEKLKEFIKATSRVFRNEKETEIPTAEIVPDDVVVLSEGDRIPADGILTLGQHLEVDESLLTGESLPMLKKQGDPLLKGTLVVKGKGHLLVKKTGMKTRFGQIAQGLSQITSDKTSLQKHLDSLGKVLSLLAIVIALLLIPIGLTQERALFPLLLLAISIGIAAIPEGLPAVVTIALAIGTHRMAKKNAIVRKMPAVETLGSIQVILIDKTGTLTQNSMQVKKWWTRKKADFSLMLRAALFGNTASLVQKAGSFSKENVEVVGDKTDGALLSWVHNNVEDIVSLEKEGKVTDEYVFDPASKTITTVWEKDGKKYVFVRGAPEVILAKSTLLEKEKKEIQKHFESYAKEGLRIIGFGTKVIKDGKTKREDLERDLDFLGFVGIYDPPRKEAKQAVENAKAAGIRTVMVTGDNEFTALAIAREVGLIEKDEEVITGDKLDQITDADLEKLLDKIRIFARAKPEDKLRLVSLFKKRGTIVGVTGDGVNDALALKRADVGIAMGQSGTDVAKEASQIVLTDDNFSTIVHAVLEGRTIYSNIVKAVTYLLSGNLSELALIVFATLLGMPSPLLPTQILWINLVTDGLPALALAADSKDDNLLRSSPRNPHQPILTQKRILFITGVGLGLSLILLVFFQLLLEANSETFARTVTFNLLVFLHLIIAFLVRGRGIFQPNRFLILAVLGTIVVQLTITFVPFLQNIFHLGF